jgi:oligoribonuclease NrnB/cAMP/cGMP phosphodiesterase (DHH superfamily)
MFTDLVCKRDTLEDLLENHGGNIIVLDHHESTLWVNDVMKEKLSPRLDALAVDPFQYDALTVKCSDKNGKCSGTSLLYNYLYRELMRKDLITEIFNGYYGAFAEVTRLWDTFEWKKPDHGYDLAPKKLATFLKYNWSV